MFIKYLTIFVVKNLVKWIKTHLEINTYIRAGRQSNVLSIYLSFFQNPIQKLLPEHFRYTDGRKKIIEFGHLFLNRNVLSLKHDRQTDRPSKFYIGFSLVRGILTKKIHSLSLIATNYIRFSLFFVRDRRTE